MTATQVSKLLFLASGGYAVLCAPAVLVAEHMGWQESFLHASQFLAIVICVASALSFLWLSRARRSTASWFAVAAVCLGGLWLAFLAYVVFFSGPVWTD